MRTKRRPDEAGGPALCVLGYTWKPVYAGGHRVYVWETRHHGRPSSGIYRHLEAGPRRRPGAAVKGSPNSREAR